MAVEIREMIIQAKVAGGNNTPQKNETPSGNQGFILSNSQKKQIITECVQAVMDELNKINQR